MHPASVHSISFLNGTEIVRWVGAEMALSQGEMASVWEDVSIPYLQLDVIDIYLRDGSVQRLYSQLGDGTAFYGLFLFEASGEPLKPTESVPPKSIFRTRDLWELPTGSAEVAILRQEGSNAVIEAEIYIGSRTIRLLAAEVEESITGEYRVVEGDESILLQIDGVRPDHSSGRVRPRTEQR
jgi:hypothetical protein